MPVKPGQRDASVPIIALHRLVSRFFFGNLHFVAFLQRPIGICAGSARQKLDFY
jgi:hypothetical protein